MSGNTSLGYFSHSCFPLKNPDAFFGWLLYRKHFIEYLLKKSQKLKVKEQFEKASPFYVEITSKWSPSRQTLNPVLNGPFPVKINIQSQFFTHLSRDSPRILFTWGVNSRWWHGMTIFPRLPPPPFTVGQIQQFCAPIHWWHVTITLHFLNHFNIMLLCILPKLTLKFNFWNYKKEC